MNTENDIDLLADAKHETDLASQTGSDKLDTLKGHALKQIALEDEIAQLQTMIDERSKELTELRTKTLPLAFGALQLTSITVGNTMVRVETGVDARMPNAEKEPDKRKLAMQWLIDNKHQGVIKVELSLAFAKGDWNTAKEVADLLKDATRLNKALGRKKGSLVEAMPAILSESVHASTYKALMRDLLMNKNAIVPEEALGVFRYTYTVIDRPELDKPKKATKKAAG